MKVNELNCKDVMVGDWVDVRNDASPNTPHLESITPSHFFRDEHWYGVEIVPEILEKNGFVKFIAGQYILPKGDNEWMVNIVPNLSSAPNSNGTMLVAIKNDYTDAKIAISYVHELQHALRLCKTEKEIIL